MEDIRQHSCHGWTVTTVKKPILSLADSDAASTTIHAPLPEICFGNNSLSLSSDKLGITFEWNTLDALRLVGKESNVKVAHADTWYKGQTSSEYLKVQKPYDWTYTTLYPGSIASTSGSVPAFAPAPAGHPGLPLHKLARTDIPITFFGEVPLFEDELGDNGTAELNVRVRVNETSVFILSRLFVRVDHVLFRVFDVRFYLDLMKGEVIRERKGRQATYDDIKKRLPPGRKDDLTVLTDVNWVTQALDSGVAPNPALPEWEGEGTVLELLQLGKS